MNPAEHRVIRTAASEHLRPNVRCVIVSVLAVQLSGAALMTGRAASFRSPPWQKSASANHSA